MKINHRRPLRLGRAVPLLVTAVCLGATQLVSGQVEIGPRRKPAPKKALTNTARPGVRPAQRERAVTVPRIEMALVQPGSFYMGSIRGQVDEKPVHSVTISKPFYLGKYEVTQGQWKAVMGANPSMFTGDDDLPVENVSWNECREFIKRLNGESGMQYRLPTEAEWEYACRAGTSGEWAGSLDSMGWYFENAGRNRLSDSNWDYKTAQSNGNGTHPVGQKQPNPWGLYDMHGNVWEWCEDWYDENCYGRSSSIDPVCATEGRERVTRGGGWFGDSDTCRSASRVPIRPDDRSWGLGFRLVRDARAPLGEQGGVPGGVPGGEPGGEIGDVREPQRVSPFELAEHAMNRPQPPYPQYARDSAIEGYVTVEVIVDEAGEVVSARCVSGHPSLCEASVSTSRDWKFRPFLLSGRPGTVIGTLTFSFKP